MGTATFLKVVHGASAAQRLYRLDPPAKRTVWDDDSNPKEAAVDFVVVSATTLPFSGPETYIFSADESGEITNWSEMSGSFRGELNHARALQNAGDEVKGEV